MEIILKYFPDLTEEQRKQFAALYDLYTDWNSKINVISRKDIENLYEHHVLHSLGIAKVIQFRPGTSIMDLGTGGGIILAEAGGKGIETGMTAATIQLGKMGIIHGARTYVIQNEDGQIEEPYSISAGLDYPGIGPIHANLAAQRRANVLAINDDEAIEAAYELTKLEGIIPALESAHALGALKKLKFKPEDIVVLTVSGRGDKDIETYLSFNEQQ